MHRERYSILSHETHKIKAYPSPSGHRRRRRAKRQTRRYHNTERHIAVHHWRRFDSSIQCYATAHADPIGKYFNDGYIGFSWTECMSLSRQMLVLVSTNFLHCLAILFLFRPPIQARPHSLICIQKLNQWYCVQCLY